MNPDPSREPAPATPESAEDARLDRKAFLRAAALAVPLPAIAAVALTEGRAAADEPSVASRHQPGALPADLEPTPFCDDGDDDTIEQTEGPYFKPGSPLRSSLVTASTVGTRLTVSGYVFGRSCQPLSGVLMDFWQADNNGTYDNVGYTFRGHQFTDSTGAFRLETIVPGLYPGRTRHIHVKAQAPGHPVLTTQLYFPNEPRNATDTIFDPRLLMTVRQNGNARQGTFDFVLDVVGPSPTPTQTPTQTQTPTPTQTSTPSPTDTAGSTWREGGTYRVGDVVTYGGASYRCLQAHTAYPGWTPPVVPALWQRV